MKLIFGGVRGTTPIADPAFLHYGGSTTSFMIEGHNGDAIVIDVGTGTRTLAAHLSNIKKKSVLVLMTHYHQDHLIGFPGFPLIYNSDWHLCIKGPQIEEFTAQQVFGGLMAKPFWPLQLNSLQAHIEFSANDLHLTKEPMKWGDIDIRWCPIHHLGGCLAYRFDEVTTKRSIIIATDIEWELSTDQEKAQFIHFCSTPGPADVLVFDGHFTPENYEQFKGWGHSTWQDAVSVCGKTGSPTLYITHHAQGNNDVCLAQLEQEMQTEYPDSLFARQGDVIELSGENI